MTRAEKAAFIEAARKEAAEFKAARVAKEAKENAIPVTESKKAVSEFLKSAILEAQNHPFQVIQNTEGLSEALEGFETGFGLFWTVDIEGVKYQVKKADGDYTARPLKVRKDPMAAIKMLSTPDADE